MQTLSDTEIVKIREATKKLLRDSFIPRDNPGDERCKAIYNTIVNAKYQDIIRENLSNVGFTLHVNTEPGLETVWITDTDENEAPKNVLKKAESMVYCLLIKQFMDNRSKETKTTAAVMDVQTLMDQMEDLNARVKKNDIRDILFAAQERNLVCVKSNIKNFDKQTIIVILSSICFFFSFEQIAIINNYLDQLTASNQETTASAKDDDDGESENGG